MKKKKLPKLQVEPKFQSMAKEIIQELTKTELLKLSAYCTEFMHTTVLLYVNVLLVDCEDKFTTFKTLDEDAMYDYVLNDLIEGFKNGRFDKRKND